MRERKQERWPELALGLTTLLTLAVVLVPVLLICPFRQMGYHHLVNDFVGGVRVVSTY